MADSVCMCADLRTCTETQYEDAAPTATTDRVCRARSELHTFRVWMNASYVEYALASPSHELESALESTLRERVAAVRGYVEVVLEENSVLAEDRTVANVSARSVAARAQVEALGEFEVEVQGTAILSVLYTEDEAIAAAKQAYLAALGDGEAAARAAAEQAYENAHGMRNFTTAWRRL
ncbi:hypothetical protein PTSG_03205 [Salpingoeca rosetta]|uniref:Uncharacterized protein n=1 Tax=Salpingoeca rosetta (strain ATCC 50818 / BSB-021) TaxID=946362 RepID=F2U4I7_SALR5|nr:uncharacterized protein PTSG_03205 [Salpingoeca rosetta]EGD82553.1 hypothetical protein PTSG_03205 [Salpingoeca rosetta]|eukprot:XP_004995789.1 hypothetical protein PTSG_03205 [Salpingoeca rosetta]